jgi:hypothetical protein
VQSCRLNSHPAPMDDQSPQGGPDVRAKLERFEFARKMEILRTECLKAREKPGGSISPVSFAT